MKTYYFSVLSATFKEYFSFFPGFLHSTRQFALSKLIEKHAKAPSPELEQRIKELQKECGEIDRKCYNQRYA